MPERSIHDRQLPVKRRWASPRSLPVNQMPIGVKSRPMKKTPVLLCFATLIAALPLPTFADWNEIHRFEDGMRIFVDKTTAQRDGKIAEVMHLVRWAEPQNDDEAVYLSTVVHTRYDCEKKLEKYLGSTSYAGAMGDGEVVVSDEDEVEKWYTISNASMEEKLWSVACSAN